MNTNSLYISSVKPHAGSLIVSMGMMEILRARFEKIAFYRPFIERKKKPDSDISFMMQHYNLQMKYEDSFSFYVDEVEALVSSEGINKVLSKVLEDYKALEKKYNFILCEGLNRESFTASLMQDLNISVSKNLGTPFISVFNAKDRGIKDIKEELYIESEVLKKQGCVHFTSFINRVDIELHQEVSNVYKDNKDIFVLSEVEELDFSTVEEVMQRLECTQLLGNELSLHRTIKRSKIAAMNLENYQS